MIAPILFVVDDDPAGLHSVEGELRKRYGADYRVVAHTSPEDALDHCAELDKAGEPVALLVADLWMPSMTGLDFLARAHDLYPTAKRVALMDRGDRTAMKPVIDASALGQIDCHMFKPRFGLDETLHEVVTELLGAWVKDHVPRPEAVRVIGEQWSPRCHEVRDLLGRYGVPYGFYSSESPEGRAMLAALAPEGAELPVLALFDGRVLLNPTNLGAADALATTVDLTQPFDVVVVGAGPAGLAAAVYATSEGLRTVVVEREAIGGQAGTTSRIRNYLGFPRGISGKDLAVRAYEQAFFFGTSFSLMREATELQPGFPHHTLVLSDGAAVRARAVVVAAGVSYRRLGVPSLERLVGRGVFYGPAVSEAPTMASQAVFVAGGGNSAGQAAVHLARYASTVTVLVRGDSLAESMSDYLIREMEGTRNIEVRFRTEAVGGAGERRLDELVLRDANRGTMTRTPAGGLFVLIGAEPHTEWLPPDVRRDTQGYVLTGPDVAEEARPGGRRASGPPLLLETSVPGVFAAGDVRHRSIKRVASAAGEGAMVVAAIHEHLSRSGIQLARS